MESDKILTLAETIHIYEHGQLRCQNFTPEAVCAAYVNGLAALREKQEREDPQPLTWEEVEATPEGEPLYIIHSLYGSGWTLKRRETLQSIRVTMHIGRGDDWLSGPARSRDYGKTWTAYRHRPEGNTEGRA